MTVISLVIVVTCVCCLAATLLHRYGNWKKQTLLVTVAAFMSWYFSLLIIFVMPLDVSNTHYRQCLHDHPPTTLAPVPTVPFLTTANWTTSTMTTGNISSSTAQLSTTTSHLTRSVMDAGDMCKKPWSYVPPKILPTVWHVVYWTSQVLTWLILPIMQSYARAGDFTVAGKIRSSLIENAIYYGTYLLIFGICLLYVALKPNLHINGPQLKVLAITASNTWGLFLLVLLYGYGLVEVPRTCWNNSKKGHLLDYTYFKLAKLSVEKSEAEENLEDVLEDVKKAAETIRYNHALRACVDTILEKCPEAMRGAMHRNRDDFEDYNPTETPTEKSLVRLHKRVIAASQAYQRTQCQWGVLVEKAFNLEDVSLNEASSKHVFVRSFGSYSGIWKAVYSPTVEWYWRCWVMPLMLKALTVILGIVSAMVIWSECLFFIRSPVLSLFAIFIDLAGYNYIAIEVTSYLIIAYLCVCAYYTIFRVRVFNYYYLASHHQTDENSLIFCGMLLCRLTPPLCLNFLGLIHLDSHITKQSDIVETSYTQIMGHMDVISIVSDGFNIYFPIAIVVLCFATYFRLGSRCLHLVGFQQFVGDDDMTLELVQEGRNLMKRERRKRERTANTESRKRTWQEKFDDNSRSGAGDDVDNRRTPRQAVARSPQENDRTELLREAEPLDYTADSRDMFEGVPQLQGVDYESSARGYQTQHSATPRGRAAGPPRNIFDDV